MLTSLKGTSVPLCAIHYEIQTNGRIMNLIIKQVYKNTHQVPLECEYAFPVGSEMAVHELIIHNQEGSSKAEIFSKKQREENYEDAISKGEKVYKIQYKEGMNDILDLKIGLLDIDEEIHVELKMIGLLTLHKNMCEIRIPTSYSPRYPSKSRHVLHSSKDVSYFWTLNFEIVTPTPILSIRYNFSPNIELEINYSESNTKATGEVPSKQEPNTDIVIYYEYENMHSSTLILQKNLIFNEYAAFISIWPEDLKASTGFNNLPLLGVKPKETASEMNKYRGEEYIFLLDASYSMEGAKFHLVKYICDYLLNELPPISSFNIIFFGAGINEIFQEPVSSTSLNILEARKILANSYATMGNSITDQFISKFSGNSELRTFRTIYFLTGGGITSPKKIISEIKNNNYDTRVHSIGIGHGVNQNLITKVASAGKGCHIFITDIDNIESKLSKIQTNLSVLINPTLKWDFDQANIIFQFPNEHQLSNLRSDEPFNLFAIFTHVPDIFSVEFSIFDMRDNSMKYFSQIFSKKKVIQKGYLFKLVAKQLLDQKQNLCDVDKRNISMKYSVLAYNTAFVGMNLEKLQREIIEASYPVIIPISIPTDYSINSNNSDYSDKSEYSNGDLIKVSYPAQIVSKDKKVREFHRMIESENNLNFNFEQIDNQKRKLDVERKVLPKKIGTKVMEEEKVPPKRKLENVRERYATPFEVPEEIKKDAISQEVDNAPLDIFTQAQMITRPARKKSTTLSSRQKTRNIKKINKCKPKCPPDQKQRNLNSIYEEKQVINRGDKRRKKYIKIGRSCINYYADSNEEKVEEGGKEEYLEEEREEEYLEEIFMTDPTQIIHERVELIRKELACQFCDDNGEALTTTMRVCLHCHSSLRKKKRKKYIWRLVAGFVFLLMLCVFAALSYYLMDNDFIRIIIFTVNGGIIFLALLIVCYWYRSSLKDKICCCLNRKESLSKNIKICHEIDGAG